MKKAMSLLTATAMAATLLAGCGGGAASSSAALAADSTSTEASSTAAEPAADAAAEEGKVLNIWCWNDEFQSRFNDYYPGVKEIAADKSTTTLNNGVTVKWTINPNDNNNYQNKLDEALLKQDSAAADDKIDIFLIEADYALKYVDSEYTLDVKKDVGLTDDDLKDQYQYTKDIVTVDGVQKGTTWQATPGLFAYRRSIAEDVLGTDDPTEVQAALSDWDKFNDVAEKAAAKGYKMLSGYDDSYRTFSNNVSAGWVDGTTVKVDPNIMNWVDQTKTYTDNGYNNKTSLWSDQWAADQGPAGADPGKGRCVLPLCVGAYDRPGPQRHAGADREHPLHHCGLPRRGAAGLPGLYRGWQPGRVWPRGGRADRADPLLPGERLRHGQAVRRPDEPRRVPEAGRGPHLDAHFERLRPVRRSGHDDQRNHP